MNLKVGESYFRFRGLNRPLQGFCERESDVTLLRGGLVLGQPMEEGQCRIITAHNRAVSGFRGHGDGSASPRSRGVSKNDALMRSWKSSSWQQRERS